MEAWLRWLVDVLLLLSLDCSFSQCIYVLFYHPGSRPGPPQTPHLGLLWLLRVSCSKAELLAPGPSSVCQLRFSGQVPGS